MCTKTIYLFESHHRVNRLLPECVYIQQMLRLSFIYSYLFHDFRMFCRWRGMLLFMSSVLIFLMCDLSHISRVTQSIHHPNRKDSIYTDNKKKVSLTHVLFYRRHLTASHRSPPLTLRLLVRIYFLRVRPWLWLPAAVCCQSYQRNEWKLNYRIFPSSEISNDIVINRTLIALLARVSLSH